MVTLQSAENALKTVYLGAVTELLNTKTNPFLTKIEQTSADIWGKEIRTSVRSGLAGGVGAGDESGALPKPYASKYLQFSSTLKNLYGQIEISDKAIRASADGRGAFTDLLNAELESLLSASKFNLGRMLYGDGSGALAMVMQNDGIVPTVDNTNHLIEGMVLDFYVGDTFVETGFVVTGVDRAKNKLHLDHPDYNDDMSILEVSGKFYVQGSRNKEITGVGAIFDEKKPLYGNKRNAVPFLKPYQKDAVGKLDEIVIQTAIDAVENASGSTINFIAASAEAKYAYQEYMAQYKRNIDIMDLDGGYKSMSYNGIPFVYDRFVKPGEMFMFDATDFKMYQLCDWQFLENENGKILRQTQGKPTYTATLVKYCDLICKRPNGQAKLSGITRA